MPRPASPTKAGASSERGHFLEVIAMYRANLARLTAALEKAQKQHTGAPAGKPSPQVAKLKVKLAELEARDDGHRATLRATFAAVTKVQTKYEKSLADAGAAADAAEARAGAAEARAASAEARVAAAEARVKSEAKAHASELAACKRAHAAELAARRQQQERAPVPEAAAAVVRQLVDGCGVIADRHDGLSSLLLPAGSGPDPTGLRTLDADFAALLDKAVGGGGGLTEAVDALSADHADLAWLYLRGGVAAASLSVPGPAAAAPAGAAGTGGDWAHKVNYAAEAAVLAADDTDSDESDIVGGQEDAKAGTMMAAYLADYRPTPKADRARLFGTLERKDAIVNHPRDYEGPTDESNWVVPGRILVGAFPGSVDDDENFDLLVSILRLGTTVFCCLQQEYDPDVGEAHWRYDEDGGALRPYFDDAKAIVREVRDSTTDLSRELGQEIALEEDRLQFVHLPIIDCDVAEDAPVFKLAQDLVELCARGEVLYIHCWGGHGRTGTIVCLMLHLMYGMGSDEAMDYCQLVHDLRAIPMPDVRSPQKPRQRRQVRRIVRQLQAAAGR